MVSGVTLGNGVVESAGYNNRLQRISASALRQGLTLLSLSLCFCAGQAASCSTNNGNAVTQVIGAVNGETTPELTQSYGYDKLNRLTIWTEGNESQVNGYDAWGNRWQVSQTVGLLTSNLTPEMNWFTTGTNGSMRMSGVVYDGAGNQLVLSPFTLAYDGEGRVKAASSASNGNAGYEYDAEGRRVKRTVNGVTTYQVYDGMGRLIAEQGGSGGSGGCVTCYLTTDNLGSTRLVTNESGGVDRRYDYTGFGVGLAAGVNARGLKYSVGAFPAAGDGTG